MPMTDLTYGAAFADVYDEWYGDDAETAATVRTLTELVSHIATPRVLELGAGTGRLAIPLAAALAAGVVVALDESPEMLQILRSRMAHADPSVGNVIVVEGNMADLAALSTHGATAGEPFDLVFASYNTFFNLHEPGDQARCLCAPRHATTNEVRGEWTLQTTTDFDPVTGLIVGSTHSTRRDGREVKRPWRIRYQSPTQLDALCTAAGLELVSRYGSWQMSTFGDDAARHISAYQLVR
ncbi:MAG: class I SAM-dependent methyltransferase [Actinobacteria bacterium]|nr:class I SAM-dependent methyltransferase [Actinomycetota bacterium]